MAAAGDHPQGQIHPLGQQQLGGGNQRLGVAGVVEHFQFAIVHINAGVRTDAGSCHNVQHFPAGNPETGAQAGCTLEHLVINGCAIQRHQPAHGGTGDDGVAPVGQGAVVRIDEGLQLLDHPVHVHISLAANFAQGGVFIAQGGVFNDALVAIVVAFHGYNDELFFAFLHVFVHAPGFSEGSVLIKKNVVPVEHIHHGIAPLGLPFVAFRQIKVDVAGGVTG